MASASFTRTGENEITYKITSATYSTLYTVQVYSGGTWWDKISVSESTSHSGQVSVSSNIAYSCRVAYTASGSTKYLPNSSGTSVGAYLPYITSASATGTTTATIGYFMAAKSPVYIVVQNTSTSAYTSYTKTSGSSMDVTGLTASTRYKVYASWYEGSTQKFSSAVYFTTDTPPTPTTYTITVSASPEAGGTVSGGGSYTSGSTCKLTATKNTGYKFLSWYDGSSYYNDNPYEFPVSSNKSFTGYFGKVYTVSTSNGSFVSSISPSSASLAKGDKQTFTATMYSPSTGYAEGTTYDTEYTTSYSIKSGGWTVTSGSGSCSPTSGATTTFTLSDESNATVTATGTPSKSETGNYRYHVSYYGNGGSGSMYDSYSASSKYTSGTKLITISSNSFTRDGYTFTGWNTNSAGTGTSYSAGSQYITSNLTLYAQWEQDGYVYTLDYNENAGYDTVTDMPEDVRYPKTGKTQLEEHTFNLSGTPKRSSSTYDYTFSGWSETRAGDIVTSVKATKDDPYIDVYAIWNRITYSATLKLNANGGSFGSETYKNLNLTTNKEQDVTFYLADGTTYKTDYIPTAPTGYKFSHYYESGSTYTPVYNKTLKATSAGTTSTVFAAWNPISYNISATVDPELWGYVTGDTGSQPYDKSVTLTATPSIDWLYQFDYWTVGSSTTKITSNPYTFTVKGDTSLVAHFKQRTHTYRVKYNANGGQGTLPNDEVYPPSGTTTDTSHEFTLDTKAVLTKDGYSFGGWAESAESSEQITKITCDASAATKTVYARWVKQYIITYKSNYTGGPEDKTQTKTHGTDIKLLASNAFDRGTSYTIASWNTASDGSGTKYDVSSYYTDDAALTLYAQWKCTLNKFYWDGTDTGASDLSIINVGKPITNMTLARWNDFKVRIKAVLEAQGKTWSGYAPSVAGTFYYSDYKDVWDAINKIDGHGTMPALPSGAGAEIKAAYFVPIDGSANLRDALNTAIGKM